MIQQLGPRRGRYKSTPLVRNLRLKRLKDTSMSVTASLDKRKAVALGATSIPAPKVYGRKGGQFSDITRLLSSSSPGVGGTKQSAKSPDSNGDTTNGNALGTSTTGAQKAPSEVFTEGSGPETPGVSEAQLAVEASDDYQASLILNTQKRKPGGLAALRNGDSELAKFVRSFQKKDRLDHKKRVEKRIIQITRRIRRRCNKEMDRLNEVGLFHADANRMRVDTMFNNQLKRHLNLDRIEEECMRDMLADSKGEKRTHGKKAAAMEDKFAAAAAAAGSSFDQKSDSTVKGSESKITAADSRASSKVLPSGSLSGSAKSRSKASLESSSASGSLASRSRALSNSKRDPSIQLSTSNGKKKAGFRPGENLSKEQSERVAEDTQKLLKKKVRTKFASGEADIDAEAYANQDVDADLEDQDGSLWDPDENDANVNPEDVKEDSSASRLLLGHSGVSVADGSSAILADKSRHGKSERSVRFSGTGITSSKSVTGSMSSAVGEELQPGSVLEDGSVVVDADAPERRYAEYEIRYDEWGQEVKVMLPPRVRPMAKTKKDDRVDSFEVFRKKKMAEARAKKMKRHRLLMKGELENTIDDKDFVDDLGYRSSTIAQALGRGKHTPARMQPAPVRPVGGAAISKPLPGYIRNEVNMARRAAGLEVEAKAADQKTGAYENAGEVSERPSSVPSWAVDSMPSTATSGSLSMSEAELNPNTTELGQEKENDDTLAKTQKSRKRERKKGSGSNAKLRQRVENLWEDLEMPFLAKMSFAARYSEPRRAESMNDALPLWEKAAALVKCRERLLTLFFLVNKKVRSLYGVRSRYSKVSLLICTHTPAFCLPYIHRLA